MTALGRHHALVIGSSMAGLAPARILAHHFQRLTVLERRHRPARGESTAAQVRKPHVLLGSGAAAPGRTQPGVPRGFRSPGAGNGSYANLRHWNEGYRLRADCGITSQPASRGLIRAAARERVAAIPEATIGYGTGANALLATEVRPPLTRLSSRSGKQTLRATTVDPVVGRPALKVQPLLARPSGLRAQRAWRAAAERTVAARRPRSGRDSTTHRPQGAPACPSTPEAGAQ